MHFKSTEWAASFGIERTKEEALMIVSNNAVLSAHLRSSLSDPYCAMIRIGRDVLFPLFRHQ